MQSQERELITGLFGRLQPFESQARDPEAEALIREGVQRQPASPYLLVQTVLVQEQALKAAQERIAELEAKAGAAPAASGFLGSAPKIGPWGAAQPAAAAPPPVPSTRSPLQAALSPQPAGGGFLRTAMATAAGVAGGALLFEGIRNLMGSNPGPFGQAAAAQPAPLLPQDSQQALDDNPMPADLRNDDRTDDYDTAAYDDSDSDVGGGSNDDDWA
ncbi:MAG: DUF2076 domain-containing protein [Reyranella sp.]|jgi:hypothetical protein|nr:DUF2076 domain-containing protein [Reyranella sp.]